MSDLVLESNKYKFTELLKSTKRAGIDKLISYLESTDFFEAPASTKYHGNFKGALVEHSINVYNQLAVKNNHYSTGLAADTMLITALLHDVCKINLYHRCITNEKNNKTGKWEHFEGFGFDDDFPIGHGEKSIIKLLQFIRLTKEEIYMIRWHMGSIGESWSNSQAISKIFKEYPGALLLHTADMEASYLLEKTVKIKAKKQQ